MLTAQHEATVHFMKRQVKHVAVTPRDVVLRLFQHERDLGLPSAAEFARQIGITPEAISPQQLSNWRGGDDISLDSLLRLKPTVRARLLLERPAEQELLHEGMRLGLAAARLAVEREEQRLQDAILPGSSEQGTGVARSRRQLEAALEAEQAERTGSRRQPQTRRRKPQ